MHRPLVIIRDLAFWLEALGVTIDTLCSPYITFGGKRFQQLPRRSIFEIDTALTDLFAWQLSEDNGIHGNQWHVGKPLLFELGGLSLNQRLLYLFPILKGVDLSVDDNHSTYYLASVIFCLAFRPKKLGGGGRISYVSTAFYSTSVLYILTGSSSQYRNRSENKIAWCNSSCKSFESWTIKKEHTKQGVQWICIEIQSFLLCRRWGMYSLNLVALR